MGSDEEQSRIIILRVMVAGKVHEPGIAELDILGEGMLDPDTFGPGKVISVLVIVVCGPLYF